MNKNIFYKSHEISIRCKRNLLTCTDVLECLAYFPQEAVKVMNGSICLDLIVYSENFSVYQLQENMCMSTVEFASKYKFKNILRENKKYPNT